MKFIILDIVGGLINMIGPKKKCHALLFALFFFFFYEKHVPCLHIIYIIICVIGNPDKKPVT